MEDVMRKAVRMLFVLFGWMLMFETTAIAEIVTFTFTGRVTFLQDSGNVIGGKFAIGNAVSGRFVYDTNASPEAGGGSCCAFYRFTGPPAVFEVTVQSQVGPMTFTGDGSTEPWRALTVFVQNDVPFEAFGALSSGGTASNWPLPLLSSPTMEIVLGDSNPPQNLLSSNALPTQLDLTRADLVQGSIRSGRFGPGELGYQIVFSLDSITSSVAPPPPISRLPVVVIPGIMGTYLYEVQPLLPDDLIWIDVDEAVQFEKDEFLYNLLLDSSGNSIEQIKNGSILDGSILGLSRLFTNKYRDLLDSLRAAGYRDGETLFVFPYDWRLNNAVNAQILRDFINHEVLSRSGQTKVDIVAHSMGGLVARYYAAQLGGEAKINKIIYIATPHQGAPKAFGTLAFNNRLLDNFLTFDGINVNTLADIARTMPSVFQLLPRQPFIFVEPQREFLTLEQSYLQRPAGPLQSSRWVDLANSFHSAIDRQLQVEQFSIIGSGLPTVDGLRLRLPEAGSGSWKLRTGNGDITVPFSSATLAGAVSFYFNGNVKDKEVEHADLANDPMIRDLVLKILRNDLGELPDRISREPFQLPSTFNWYTASPVRVTIRDEIDRVNGFVADESLVRDIPGSDFFRFEDSEGGFLLADQNYQIELRGTATGVFSLSFEETDGSQVVLRTISFNNVPVGSNSRAHFELTAGFPMLQLDVDGDGITDIWVIPNAPLPPLSYLTGLQKLITSYILPRGIETSLTSKARAAVEAIDRGQTTAARNVLNSLANELNALSGLNINKEDADGLIKIIGILTGRL